MNSKMVHAWDVQAGGVHEETGEPIEAARDHVILWWLRKGDTRPFYDWVLSGHTPSREVVVTLAAMMAQADSPDALSSKLEAAVPYALRVAGKRRGDRSNPEVDARDYFIGREVARRIADGDGYESAISTVHGWLPSVGINVTPQTVRNAYDERRQTTAR
jgi:hypothetical protein